MNIGQSISAHIAAGAPSVLDVFLGAPAVFTPVRHPGYSYTTTPAAIVRQPTLMDDLLNSGGGLLSDALVQVALYALFPENSNDDTAVNDAVAAIRALFRGVGFVGDDGLTYQALVSGPIAAPVSSPELTGAILQLRLKVGG